MSGLTYKAAGVDVDAGEALVRRITPAAKATARPGVMGGLGGFGAMFDLAAAGYRDSVLVAATDGVGTKLRIALDVGRLDDVGIDLVAMCVNDLVCQGAEPLFFLDYLACASLDADQAATVIEGIAGGCEVAGCALIGGETAEMPGMYAPGDLDLAGFAVGAAPRDGLLPAGVAAGDVVLGLWSSGVHSNGFSLVRAVAERAGVDWDDPAPFSRRATTLGEALLVPTVIYVKPALAAIRTGGVRALAHVTGGGLPGNLPRVLPEGLGARIDLGAIGGRGIFRWLAEAGGIAEAEMLRAFNCGIGMCVVVAPEAEAAVTEALGASGSPPVRLGAVEAGEGLRTVGTLFG